VADVADARSLRAIAEEFGPITQWFHMAAQADVRVSVADPIADATTNVLGTISVLEAARLHNAQVVLASTGGAIFGDSPIPTAESGHERPESPYGAAKLSAENYAAMFGRLYDAPHVAVRYANVYGPRQDPHGEAGVVAIFGSRVLAETPATIFGDGMQTRDYVYVADVVDATIGAGRWAAERHAEREKGDTPWVLPVFNVGSGVETTVVELWDVMCQQAGMTLPPLFGEARVGEVRRSALDASYARETLGVALDTPLSHGLQATLEWMRTQ
jgi:UDP-glucose 4-epimerase